MLVGCPVAYPEHFRVNDTEIYTTPEKTPQEMPVRRSESPVKPPRVVTMNVSAYTIADDECGKGDGVTASGIVGKPFLSCASDDLPIGTHVRINGKIWIVHDRFGGGYRNRLDLLMETKEQCFSFGRRYINVEVLD